MASGMESRASLSGKTALVTGAGRGLGRSIAAALHQAGATVIAVARSVKDLENLQAELPHRLETWVSDVTTDAFLSQVAALNTLDILVNNAGANRPEPVSEVSDENLDFLLNLNVRSVFRLSRIAADLMATQGNGVIVNMSSQMGHVGAPNRSVYCMTKHAVEGLTKAMAIELAPKGVRVNSVAPTFVETPMTESMFSDGAFKEYVLGMIPMGKMATAEDVADAVVYLSSPGSSMITGHSLRVDGGWTAH